MVNDMTKGSPFKILLKFVIPLLLSMVFQQLYNLADSVIAGRFLGVDALAATGAAYPITVLFIAVASGASVGCSVVISQLFGAHEYVKMRRAINTAVITLVTAAIALTLIGELACPWLMHLIKTPKSIFGPTMIYLRIYIAGLLFLFLYNTATAIFNGLGNSRTPLYFLAFSTTFNVVLDIVFVRFLDMGIAGVGWATLIAQGVSSLLAVVTLVKEISRMEAGEKSALFDVNLLKKMAYIAIPSICQQSFVSVGVFCVQGLINPLGSSAVAGFSAALKVSTFAIMVMNALPNALSGFAAQNIGAHDIKRVRQGVRDCVIMSEIVIAGVIVLFFGAGRQILTLFLGANAHNIVLSVGMEYLLIVAPFYPLLGVKNCCDSVLRGGGAMGSFMLTTFSDLFLRVALAYILVPKIGFAGVCYAYPIGWAIGTTISAAMYLSNIWIPRAVRRQPSDKSQIPQAVRKQVHVSLADRKKAHITAGKIVNAHF